MRIHACLFVLFMAMTRVFAMNLYEGGNNTETKNLKYRVQGIVLDEQNEPLPGAQVRVVGTTMGAGTDSDGKFQIHLNSDEPRNVQVSYMGYETRIMLIEPGDAVLRISMKPSSNSLNELVITGNVQERPLKEVPVLTRVITQKDIQAINPVNMETLLQYELPGLQISYDNMSHQPQLSYQGAGGAYILFLIDGERIGGEGSDHNVDFTRFNIDDIERIEVIKGSQATIYGSNALGGVVNIITKSASRPFSGYVNMRYAGKNGQKYSVSAGSRQNKFSTYTALTWRQQDTYRIEDKEGQDIVVEHPDGSVTVEPQDPAVTTVYGYQVWDLMQKLGYVFNEHLQADFKGTFYHNKKDVMEGKMHRDFFIDYALNGKLKYIPGENQQLTFSYLYDHYKKDKDFFQSGKVRTDYLNHLHIPRLEYVGQWDKHTVTAGMEANLEYLKHYMLRDSADAENQSYAFFAQEDWKILPQLNLVAGLRADYHKRYHWHLTPKISALWNPCDYVTLRAGFSQGFRSPSLKELYQAYDMGGQGWMMLYGNPNLKPETSNQYAASAEFNYQGWNLSVSYVYNKYKDKITLVPLNNGTSDQKYENSDHAKTSAVEAILRYHWPWGVTLTASYAYTDDYQEIDGKNASYVRPHAVTFNAMLHHKWKKIGFNCALNGQWGSHLDTYTFDQDTKNYEMTSYDARFLCSFNTGVTLPRGISLNLGIDNLFNYKDKAANSALQVPQQGISCVGTLSVNLADMFHL